MPPETNAPETNASETNASPEGHTGTSPMNQANGLFRSSAPAQLPKSIAEIFADFWKHLGSAILWTLACVFTCLYTILLFLTTPVWYPFWKLFKFLRTRRAERKERLRRERIRRIAAMFADLASSDDDIDEACRDDNGNEAE